MIGGTPLPLDPLTSAGGEGARPDHTIAHFLREVDRDNGDDEER